MKRKIIQTADGSSTIYIDEMDVTYHSRHGAVQESGHVFIGAGLKYFISNNPIIDQVRIFEMGLGTGLNALLSWQYAKANNIRVFYEGVELFPLTPEEASELSYNEEMLQKIHSADWVVTVELDNCFSVSKQNSALNEYHTDHKFHIVYYDAFAPGAQPELWTVEIFSKMYELLEPNGILVTYCSKGDVRRAMLAAGFEVEKVPGPPGKREMLRALKKQH